MKIKKTPLQGCYILEPTVFDDERGSFFESYNQNFFQELTGIKALFVQDNQSVSQRGVIRGLHFQKGEYAQSKLVRVIKGSVLDVAVDLRKESVTFGKYFSIILTGKNNLQLYIPKGFAHGFSVLEDATILSYKCDNYYCPAAEGGIRFDDPDLNIDWNLEKNEIKLKEKDLRLRFFKDLIIT